MKMSSLSMESGVLKLVHPGGTVEIHENPITAAEVMKRNPRHCVTRPDVFKYPWIVVRPESVLKPGRVYFLVPYHTIRRLLKKRGFPENYQSPSKQCQDSDYCPRVKLTSQIELWADENVNSRRCHKGEDSTESVQEFSQLNCLLRNLSVSDSSQNKLNEKLENWDADYFRSKSVPSSDKPYQDKYIMKQSLVRSPVERKKQSPVKCPEETQKQLLVGSPLQLKKQSPLKSYVEIQKPLVVRSPVRIKKPSPIKAPVEMKSPQDNYESPRKGYSVQHRTKAFAHYKTSPKLEIKSPVRSPLTVGKILQQTYDGRSGVNSPQQMLRSCLKKNGSNNLARSRSLKVRFNIPDEEETKCTIPDEEETKWRFEVFDYTTVETP